MSSIIDRFFISVGLKTDDVKKGINDLDNKLTSGFKEIAANCIAPLAGALSAGSLFNNFIQEAAQIKKLADSFKMSTGAVQEWRGAYEAAGIEANEFTSTYHDMNDYITDSIHNQSGPLQEMVDNFGLALKDMEGKTKGTEAVIMEVSDIFEKIGPQEAIGMAKRLGMSDEVIPLFQRGSKGIRELMERQKELGMYTKEDTERAKEFTKTIYEVTRSFKMALVPILSKVTPLLSKLGNIMTEAFIYVRKHTIVLQTTLAGLATIILVRLLPAIKSMTMAMMRNPLVLVIAAFLALGIIVEDFFGYLDGKKTAFGQFWSQFGTADEIKAKFASIWETLKGIVTAVSEFKITDYISPDIIRVVVNACSDLFGMIIAIGIALYDLGKAVVKAFTKEGPSPFLDALKKVFRMLFTIVGGVISVSVAIASYFLSILGMVIEVVTGIIDYFTNGSGAIKEIFDGICEFVGGFCDMVSWLIEGLCSGIVGLFEGAAKSIFGIFDGIGDRISRIKDGLLSVIGMEKDANRLAVSGRGGGNQTWIEDNSSKVYFAAGHDDGKNKPFYPSINPAMSGING